MTDLLRDRSILLTLAIFVLFVAAHLLGIGPLASVWSLAQWSAGSSFQMLLWLLVTVAAGFLLYKYGERESAPWVTWLVVPLFLVAAFLFRFDSFVYGGGNIRIADFAQMPQIIYRWYEAGSVAIASKLYHSFKSMGTATREAAVYGWSGWSLVMGLVSALGAVKLSIFLTASATKRFFAASLVLFAGCSLVLFGYAGVEAVVPAAIIWFAVATAGYLTKRSVGWLGLAWGIVLLGTLFHISLLLLFPGCAAITVSHLSRRRKSSGALVVGVLTLIGIVAVAYVKGADSLEARSVLLYPASKLPFTDYGLFSVRHLLDWLQVVLLGAPMIVPTVYLFFIGSVSRERKPMVDTLVVVCLSGLTAIFVMDPYHSVVLDSPRFMSYLAPVGILLAVLATEEHRLKGVGGRLPAIAAGVSLSLLVAILPVYHSIAAADEYVLAYLNRYPAYHPTATMAFRDAHFHRKEIDAARDWEDNLAVRSTDYFLMRGSDILRMNGNYAAAAEEQHKLVAKFPYWAEPRAMLAVNLMKQGQYAAAKPQIDTCLMLQPYEKRHLINLYSYYRDIRDWGNALQSVARAEKIFPRDTEIRTDRMLLFYRANDLLAAKTMADELLAQDSLLPFPYLVKGLMKEREQDVAGAIPLYRKFVTLAPKEPEAAQIERRLDSLTATSLPRVD